MRMHSPSLPELHAFAKAARLRSFSQAAADLHVTQGAISRSIARLQDHLGIALFTSEGRYKVLTPAGRDYLSAVEAAIHTIEQATRDVREQRGRRTDRPLRISVTPTLLSHWLIPRLPDFAAQHPDVPLSFAPYRRDDPLDDPEVDAWLRSGTDAWPAHLAADYLVGRELVPICRPADLQGPRAIRSAQDLLARPLLFHTHYPDNWNRWFAAAGVAHPQLTPAADLEQVALLVQAVIAGLGVAVVQRCLVEEDLAMGRVAVAVNQTVALERGYYLCRPQGRAMPAALERFRRWLLDQARGAPAH